jgi:hypothetical protein
MYVSYLPLLASGEPIYRHRSLNRDIYLMELYSRKPISVIKFEGNYGKNGNGITSSLHA